MSDGKVQAQTFELAREELAALRWAGAFVSQDVKRGVLQGICLDAGGKIVATDGRRLLYWVAENLEDLSAPVLLGPWPEEEIPAGEQATLSLGEAGAALRISGWGEITIPMMEGPYVKYEQVIPDPGPVCAVVRSGDLLDAIERIDAHHTAGPPVDPDGKWKHLPREEIRLSAPDQTLSLYTRGDMGYYRETPEGKHCPYDPERDGSEGEKTPGGSVDWTFTATVRACVEIADDEELFRCAVNHRYLKTVVSALQTDRGEDIAIRFTDPHKAIVFSPVRHLERKTLLMPLRLA